MVNQFKNIIFANLSELMIKWLAKMARNESFKDSLQSVEILGFFCISDVM